MPRPLISSCSGFTTQDRRLEDFAMVGENYGKLRLTVNEDFGASGTLNKFREPTLNVSTNVPGLFTSDKDYVPCVLGFLAAKYILTSHD
jgi:hypothetical protein